MLHTYSINMETFVLVETFNDNFIILDRCLASSIQKAQSMFDGEGWMIGEVMSEADFMHELQLNAFESQSNEG